MCLPSALLEAELDGAAAAEEGELRCIKQNQAGSNQAALHAQHDAFPAQAAPRAASQGYH